MRRASRPWSLLVLIALAGLLGPPAVASASDAGLQAVVKRDLAVQKRLNAVGTRLKAPSSRSFDAYVRYLRRSANHQSRISRNVLALRRRYRAQQPQTTQAKRGRLLALRGHRDLANASGTSAGVLRRGIEEMTNAPTEGTYRAAGRRMLRLLKAQDRRYDRGNRRVSRGRTLILNAPWMPTSS
ncbi:hypothetical protein [Patulibacter sp.]|uniref:hypothetical protein n=1 Tax=Patulibacter sp. TaxID=1912859 RepID=UPI00271F542E|nr:hypothetical protein [Patulibacter sp.]MDO9408736.1 hypothetical protein [Patulibacter sp.]